MLLRLLFVSLLLSARLAAAATVSSCPNETNFCCLAGRAGTANDTTLSTDGAGTLTGSAGANQNLKLQSTSGGGASSSIIVEPTWTTPLSASNTISLTEIVTAAHPQPHALIAYPGANSFVYVGFLNAPGKVVRYSPTDLTSTSTVTFTTGWDYVYQMVYDAGTDRIYALCGSATNVRIVKIDPAAMTKVDLVDEASQPVSAGSIAGDGTYLYVVTNTATDSKIKKYAMSDGAANGTLTLTGLPYGHAIAYDSTSGKLIVTGNDTANNRSWVARVTTALALDDSTFLPSGYGGSTDDIALRGAYAYVGFESNLNEIARVKVADPKDVAFFRHNLGMSCLGIVSDGTDALWLGFTSQTAEPGKIVKFDVTTGSFTRYGLSATQESPNEFGFGGSQNFFTLYMQSAGGNGKVARFASLPSTSSALKSVLAWSPGVQTNANDDSAIVGYDIGLGTTITTSGSHQQYVGARTSAAVRSTGEPLSGAVVGYQATNTIDSVTAAVPPNSFHLVHDQTVHGVSTSGAPHGATAFHYGQLSQPYIYALGSGTTWTLNDYAAGVDAPNFNVGTGATLTLFGGRHGWRCANPAVTGAGTLSIPDNDCFIVDDQSVGTRVKGYRSYLSAGANRWFLYGAGTAASAIIGKLRLGDTTEPTTAQLEVVGDQWIKGGNICLNASNGTCPADSDISVRNNNNDAAFAAEAYGAGTADHGNLNLASAAGLITAPEATPSGRVLGLINFRGYNGTAISTGAKIYAQTNALWSGTEQGTDLYVTTTAAGATTSAQRVKIGAVATEVTGNVTTTGAYTSTAADPADTGLVRLAATEKVCFESGATDTCLDTNPFTRSILDFGAVCDGTTNDATAIQAAIDALTTAGGTLVVPGGKVCATASSITPKNNVSITCGGNNGGFKALSGVTSGLFYNATDGISKATIRGCRFDLNSIAGISAWRTTDGANDSQEFHFENNLVTGVSSSGSGEFNLISIYCSLLQPCFITGNSIYGSGSTTRAEDGIFIVGAGVSGAMSTYVGENYIYNVGGDGIVGSGNHCTITNNGVHALGSGIVAGCANSVVTSNNLSVVGTAGNGIKIGASNVDIIANHINSPGTGDDAKQGSIFGSCATAGLCAGVRVTDNYATGGMYLDAMGKCTGGTGDCVTPPYGADCACDLNGDCQSAVCGTYGRWDHVEFSHNVCSKGTDSWCVRLENITNTNISSNIDVSAATSTNTHYGVRIVQLDNTDDGPISVIGNMWTPASVPAGTNVGVSFERPNSGTTGLINDVSIVGNTFGTTTALYAVGIQILNSITGKGWAVNNNNLRNATTQTSGLVNTAIALGQPVSDVIDQRGQQRNWGYQRDSTLATSDTTHAFVPVGATSTGPARLGTSPTYVTDYVADGAYTRCTTGSDSCALAAGATTTATYTGIQLGWAPIVSFVAKLEATITSVRLVAGVYSATPLAAADPAISACGFRYDTGVDTGTTCSGSVATCWRTYSNDGTSTGTVTTPTHAAALITASGRYILQVDMSDGATCRFYINGTLVATHSGANMPATTTNLGPLIGVTELTGANRAIGVGKILVEHPF